MKILNNIISKIGSDKIIHFLVFALVVAYGSAINLTIGAISFMGMLILAIIKEAILDDFFNLKDLIFGVFGGILSLAIQCTILNWF